MYLIIIILYNYLASKIRKSIVTQRTPSAFECAQLQRAEARESHLELLEDQITQLAAHINAATFRFLELIREFDERHYWSGPGLRSCAHWLNWKCGIGLGAAFT